MKRIILRAVVPGLVSLAAVAWLIAYSSSQVVGANPVIPIGDVMVSISGGAIDEFTPAGTFVQTLNTGTGSANTGSAFDSTGNFWVTMFDTGLTEFDPTGALIGAAAAPSTPESVLFDAAGHIWLGQADGTRQILELSSNGSTQLNAFTVAIEDRGTDWIDLAADQCTMHYTSEGFNVFSFNVCTNTQNANFNAAPLPNRSFAHRILPFAVGSLPAGSELVADTSEVTVLNNTGAQVRHDTAVGSVDGLLFALNLDPDGTSYWTADAFTGEVWRVDIATGNVLTHFTTSAGEGLSVKGQISAAVPTPTATGGATPTPTPAAMASGSPPQNITSVPGATVTAGTLMIMNNSGGTMITPKLTISFANADLFSSATLTGVVGETQSTATVSPITGGNSPEQANSTDFNLAPPLHVPNGQTATYTLTVTVSNNPKITMRRSPVKYAAMIPGSGFGGSGGFLAAMLLLSLGTTLVAKSHPRRLFFVLVIVMLALTSQVGCDNGSSGSGGESGGGGGGGGSVPTSMQTVQGVTATNTDGGPIIVSGLPIVLSTINVP
jgi:hypothetical protein